MVSLTSADGFGPHLGCFNVALTATGYLCGGGGELATLRQRARPQQILWVCDATNPQKQRRVAAHDLRRSHKLCCLPGRNGRKCQSRSRPSMDSGHRSPTRKPYRPHRLFPLPGPCRSSLKDRLRLDAVRLGGLRASPAVRAQPARRRPRAHGVAEVDQHPSPKPGRVGHCFFANVVFGLSGRQKIWPAVTVVISS